MRNTKRLSAAVVSFTTAIVILSAPVHAQLSEREVLRDRIDMLVSTQHATIENAPIAAVALIDELYAFRDYAPAWDDPAMIRQLFDQVLASVDHGLNPEDFHARQIGMRLNPGALASDPIFRADTEILCTDALARLGVSLHFGMLDPSHLDSAWNFSRKITRQEPLEYFNQILETHTVANELSALGPQN